MKNPDESALVLPPDYGEWLASLKQRIRSARQRAVMAMNEEQIRLYHSIGCDIIDRQKQQGWGTKIINRLAADLQESFPEMKGLSSRNLHYMRRFAQEYPDLEFVQQSAAKLPWFHIVILITKVLEQNEREWYAAEAVAQGWTRSTLELQIKHKLFDRASAPPKGGRTGAALTNFDRQLESTQANLAMQVLKDPYHFDFLGLGDEAQERDIENALMRHITRFLLELGAGFAFMGRQVRLEVGGDEFFIDLLFYHTRLKCHVVVELKATEFKPEHTGQLNFYLGAVDAQIKGEEDRPTIGLLLCKTKNRLVAEYALSGTNRPIGIAEYELVRALPEPLDRSLPSIEEIEAEFSSGLEVESG
jgi:predicted nuclease of restriction endonuclease-like (RecB) superfamily